jgi:hypothetical protein
VARNCVIVANLPWAWSVESSTGLRCSATGRAVYFMHGSARGCGAGGTSAPGTGGGIGDAAIDQPISYLVDGGCTAGETRTCQCNDGAWGLQTCNTHGTAYTPCDCTGGTEDAGECVPIGERCVANPWCCEGSCNANAEGTFGSRCCFVTQCYGPGQRCNGTDDCVNGICPP